MKIKFTTNTHLKLPEILSDTDMKYGFSLYNTGEYTTWNTEDSFKVKLLSKLDNVLSRFNVHSEDTKTAIEAIAQVVDYTNKHVDYATIPYLKVQVNIPTILNSVYGGITNLTNKILGDASTLDTNTYAGHIFKNDNIIILGTQLLKNCFSGAEANHGIDKVTEFIFFHELSHGIERECIWKYGEHQSGELISFKSKLRNLISEPNYGNINYEISANKLHEDFAVIDKQQFSNLETLHCEHYADVSGLLHLREYQITQGTYSAEKFASFVNDMIAERHKEYEFAKNSLNEKAEGYPLSNLTNTLKAANHYTSASIEELKLLLPTLDNEKLGIEEIHKITSQCAEKGYFKMIYALSTMHKEFIPVLNTLCSTFYNTESGRAYLETSNNEYNHFMENLKEKVGIDWVDKYDKLTTEIKSETTSTDKWMEMCFTSGASLEKGDAMLNTHRKKIQECKEICNLMDIHDAEISILHIPTNTSMRENIKNMKAKYEPRIGTNKLSI